MDDKQRGERTHRGSRRILSAAVAAALLFTGVPASAELGGTQQIRGEYPAISGEMAIKEDGSLWGWGETGSGRLGDIAAPSVTWNSVFKTSDGPYFATTQTTYQAEPVKVLDDVAAVSEDACTMAIKSDGSLWGWGGNEYGQVGIGKASKLVAVPTKIMDDVVSVHSGFSNTLAIKKDGSLWMWGDASYGMSGTGTYGDASVEQIGGSCRVQLKPVKVMDGVKSAYAGVHMMLAIKRDGTLWSWGDNSDARFGREATSNPKEPRNTDQTTPMKLMDGVAAACTAQYYILAVKKDGSLWGWGSASNGILKKAPEGEYEHLKPYKIMEKVKSVSVGFHCAAVVKTDGSLWMWGENDDGQAGIGTKLPVPRPVKIMTGVRAVDLSPSLRTTVVKNDGSLWYWGTNCVVDEETNTLVDVLKPAKFMDGIKIV